jgi:hypothetical protein
LGQNFTKFEPEKCDFNLYKAFFMEKNDPNLPDFEGKRNSNHQIFITSSSS